MTRPLGAAAAPDLIHAVIGYRQWRLHGAALWSPYTDDRWHRGVNTARCRAHADHADAPPGHECTCGFHAWYRPCPRLASPATSSLVAGAAALWGEVELHATGLRAQHAMVVALVRPALPGAKRRQVDEVAALLEVDAVPAGRLAAAAERHGAPVPAQLLPPRPTPGIGAVPVRPRPAAGGRWRPSSVVSGRQPPDRPR